MTAESTWTLVVVLAVAGAGIWSLTSSTTRTAIAEETMNTDTTKACEVVCGLPTSDEELRKLLTPEQYKIMRENGTEAPFKNEYWDNHEEGIYVDRITGEPLFSSETKFDSGTGWPSFTQPLAKSLVKEITDSSHGMSRTEVRSASSDSHLGHVFNDGPAPTRLRYCMNSASLRFVPIEKLEAEGYAEYLPLFGQLPTKPGTDPVAIPGVTELATFGGGCFWGVETFFRDVKGVVATATGYEGGSTANPTYKQVCAHTTGHAEVVALSYDPKIVSYETLLKTFFEYHDPTTMNRQGPDIGDQYRSVIFTHNGEQAQIAQSYIADLGQQDIFGSPIVTQVLPTTDFWKAEEYHQQYFEKQGHVSCHPKQRDL